MSAQGDDGFVSAVMAEVDRAEKPHLSEYKKRALDIRDEVANGAYRLDVAENTARGEINDTGTAYALTTWPGDDHGEVIKLDK